MTEKREFKLASIEVVKGLSKRSKYTKIDSTSTFHSSTPSQAASKAFNKFCKLNSKKLQDCKINLSVKESGDDSNKIYAYSLERKYDPQTVFINGKEVVYKYKISKKSLK